MNVVLDQSQFSQLLQKHFLQDLTHITQTSKTETLSSNKDPAGVTRHELGAYWSTAVSLIIQLCTGGFTSQF